jgi:hypothetical protein
MGNKIQKIQISSENEPLTKKNNNKNSLPPLPPLPLPLPHLPLPTLPLPTLPYRTSSKNAADKKYAGMVKDVFNSLPSNIREAFQEFTQGLMKEIYIDRTNLLKAIRDFYTVNTYKCNNTNGYWLAFYNQAYNGLPCDSSATEKLDNTIIGYQGA